MNNPALAGIIDKFAIHDLLIRYATALDTRDWSLLRTCFLDDIVATYETIGEQHGYVEVERLCRRVLEPLAGSHHMITNITADIDGDTACTTCYLQSTHIRAEPGGDNWVVAGFYSDVVVRTDEGWRIARRSLRRIWTQGRLPATSPADQQVHADEAVG